MNALKGTYVADMTSYLVQARQAKEALIESWRKLLAEGWVEVAPGVLRHPSKTDEVVFND